MFSLVFAVRDLIILYLIGMDRAVINGIFVSTAAVVCWWLYRDLFLFTRSAVRSYYGYLFAVVIHFFVCYICRGYFETPSGPFDPTSISFLALSPFFIFVKPIDIILQQSFITILVKKMSQLHISLRHTQLLFLLTFGMFHMFQLTRTYWVIGTLFFGFALFGSFLFPYMIIKKKNGIVLNSIFHLLAYDAMAVLFWVIL